MGVAIQKLLSLSTRIEQREITFMMLAIMLSLWERKFGGKGEGQEELEWQECAGDRWPCGPVWVCFLAPSTEEA